MVRPCFLILDPEYGTSISTRKLVIETAKLNVITAYSVEELLETLAAFPAVSGVVLNSSTRDRPCSEIVRTIKQAHPATPVVIVTTPGPVPCEEGDHILDTYDPQRLLDTLKSIEPRKSAAIEQRNEELASKPPEQ